MARLPVALLMLLLVSWPALAGTPTLTNLLPVAGQRGQSIDVTFYGVRLHDVREVLFHTTGVSAGELVFEKDKVKTTLTIAPDAPIGEHQVRLVTKTGVTEMVTFHVVDKPIVNEKRDEPAKNGNRFIQSTSFKDPQPIELGTMVLGRTESEDVDYFSVELKKGQSFAAEVIGMRLGRGFTDSQLTMLDAQGNEVADSDDTLLHRQDPALSLIVPKDGRYILVLRDAGYLGSTNNWYLLHLDEAIAPTLVYPLGGQPGETIRLSVIGDAGGSFSQDFKLPDQPDNDYEIKPNYKGLSALSGLPLRINHLNNISENPRVKNNTMGEAKNAESHPPSVAFNGIIERAGDNDFFKVRLKKGQHVRFHCFARSMGSSLDSVINVFDAKDSKHLQGNDDVVGSDSLLELNPPHDGDFYVRVRDHLNRGGADFAYRLEVTIVEPSMTTAISVYDRNNPQSRQAIAVPQGNRTAALVAVRRKQVESDLLPAIQDLPSGVTVQGLGPAEQANLMPIVFDAKPDAMIGTALSNLQVTSQPKGNSAQQITGDFRQRTPLVIANPNRTEYYHSTLDTIPIAITQAIPFKIDVVQPKAPLVHGGKQKIQVKLTRNQGYEEQVRLYMLYRPSGMGAPGRVDLNKTTTEGLYEIDANTSTPTRDWPMVILANANAPGGPVWASSQLFTVKVEEPYVAGSIANAKAEQGQNADVVIELEHPRDWKGQGELKLLGLPAHATAEPIMITPGQESATFKVNVADNTPPGTHRSLMCELTIQINGEPVIHRFGQGGRLRVDRIGAKDKAQARGE